MNALNGVSLTLDGELWASSAVRVRQVTLAKMLVRLEEPTAGE